MEITDKELLEDRELEYGKASVSFARIAGLWSAYLGVNIKVEDVGMMMTLMKVSRAKTAKKHHFNDSCQDARNYLTLTETIREELENDTK